MAARGANISGGFAQSIALARVFVKETAKIIILDEAMGKKCIQKIVMILHVLLYFSLFTLVFISIVSFHLFSIALPPHPQKTRI